MQHVAWLKLSRALVLVSCFAVPRRSSILHVSPPCWADLVAADVCSETQREEGGEIRMLAVYLRADQLTSNMCLVDVGMPRGGVPEMRAGSTSKRKNKSGGKQRKGSRVFHLFVL